jgi:hypothetical protein
MLHAGLKYCPLRYSSSNVERSPGPSLPAAYRFAVGVRLIGLSPEGGFASFDTSCGGVLKLATLEPKKLPIPEPIPPSVALMSGI